MAQAMPLSFHAHHSPMGAYGSLTLGCFNEKGGFALEKGAPADQNFHIGTIQNRRLSVLPFYQGATDDEAAYHESGVKTGQTVIPLAPDAITRHLNWATDSFLAPDFTFSVVTPFFKLHHPDEGSRASQARQCLPALWIKLVFDNRKGSTPMTGIFALHTPDKRKRALDDSEVARFGGGPTAGLAGDLMGFAVEEDRWGFASRDADRAFCCFGPDQLLARLTDPPLHLLGHYMGLLFSVKPGEQKEVVIAAGFFRGGNVTTGVESSYEYTRHYRSLQSVLNTALDQKDDYLGEAEARDRELASRPLSENQKWLIAHSTRSYWGNTQWLRSGGQALWVVNEGEYRMINTFDLTVDQVFFEMKYCPWAVKNELEWFAGRYSYHDEVYLPGAYDQRVAGGLSFTHDMGVANHFTPPAVSSYEIPGLDRKCFSFMTHEQLVNWVCCAGVYLHGTDDKIFLREKGNLFEQCLESLVRRDHPEAPKRNGIMKFESSRCEGGGEITTYDSLDHSLGQSRQNVYLAVKTWAAYLVLEKYLGLLGRKEKAALAASQARLCGETVAGGFDESLGYIPAVLDGVSASAIIPAVEGLVFPFVLGMKEALSPKGPHGALLAALKKHLENVLKNGVCLYPDGGWKLSSTADNSWMSKICLCQFVARQVLGLRQPEAQAKADAAHVRWEAVGSATQACSDQFTSGVVHGSRYYPRIVTTALWLEES